VNFQLSAATLIFIATIATSLVGLFGSPKLIDACLFRPYWFARRGQKEFHTLVTSGFVHGDVMHLLFNMLTFYFFAFNLERYIGMVWFAILYLGALLVSSLWTYVKHKREPDYATLGASGAVSAVLFAAIVFFPYQSIYILPIPGTGIPAPLFGVLYLAYTYYSAKQSRGRINHDAHLGGALTGLAFVALVAPGQYSELFGSLF
jgi:membrane associated rhomboid family serine protease